MMLSSFTSIRSVSYFHSSQILKISLMENSVTGKQNLLILSSNQSTNRPALGIILCQGLTKQPLKRNSYIQLTLECSHLCSSQNKAHRYVSYYQRKKEPYNSLQTTDKSIRGLFISHILFLGLAKHYSK